MAKGRDRKGKEPFFKNPWNVVLTIATVVLLLVFFFREDDNGRTAAQNVWTRIQRGEAGDAITQGISRGIESVAEGCAKPPDTEVEAHFQDKAGSVPVDEDFDADPGEICGNGKRFFCTSKPPQKPIPSSWSPPPRPGTDPNYEGPPFDAPFKESPYAMPSSKAILTRRPIRDLEDPSLKDELVKAAGFAKGKIGYLGPEIPRRSCPFSPPGSSPSTRGSLSGTMTRWWPSSCWPKG